jgi:predicted amidohydrolase YtcJ
VTRQKINVFPNPSGWHPEQRIRLDEALHAYTIAPAEVAGLKGKCGLLQPGYYADFIGLPENPFTVEPDQLFKIRPNLTCIGGEIVFEK